MDIYSLKTFFMWCSLINFGLLMHMSLAFLFFPDFIYRMHSRWFPLSRESFNTVIYGFLGLFKLFFFGFNLVPYVALHIMS